MEGHNPKSLMYIYIHERRKDTGQAKTKKKGQLRNKYWNPQQLGNKIKLGGGAQIYASYFISVS